MPFVPSIKKMLPAFTSRCPPLPVVQPGSQLVSTREPLETTMLLPAIRIRPALPAPVVTAITLDPLMVRSRVAAMSIWCPSANVERAVTVAWSSAMLFPRTNTDPPPVRDAPSFTLIVAPRWTSTSAIAPKPESVVPCAPYSTTPGLATATRIALPPSAWSVVFVVTPPTRMPPPTSPTVALSRARSTAPCTASGATLDESKPKPSGVVKVSEMPGPRLSNLVPSAERR